MMFPDRLLAADEIKKALKLNAAVSNLLDKMQ